MSLVVLLCLTATLPLAAAKLCLGDDSEQSPSVLLPGFWLRGLSVWLSAGSE